jgi:SAM-dependent methyltransferase
VAGPDLQKYRRPEPAFARAVATAVGDARTVLEVVSGSAGGSYAPTRAEVTTIGAPVGRLPFDDATFDAATTAFALPGWDDLEDGLAELRRVTRGPIVILTLDPERVERSWLTEYAPEVTAAEARRFPTLHRIAAALSSDTVTSTPLPIPFTCVDGFSEAYYARPERLLDPGARRADPAWDLVDEMTARRSIAALRTAIETGEWDHRHGALRVQPAYEGSLVLVTATRRA